MYWHSSYYHRRLNTGYPFPAYIYAFILNSCTLEYLFGLVDGSSTAFALISTPYVLRLLYLCTGEASVTVTEASVTVMKGQGKLVLAH